MADPTSDRSLASARALAGRLLARTPLKGCARPDAVVLELDLARGVLDHQPETPLAALKAMNAPMMQVLCDRLREAGRDEDVRGLLVHVSACPLTTTQAQELALAIEDFGRHRPTLAFSPGFGELDNDLPGYTVASACQQVWLQPTGQVGIGGVHLGITLVRPLLERLGVEPQMARRHEYKTAADQLGAREVSEANREMMHSVAGDLVDGFVQDVARRRRLDAQVVREAVDRSPLVPEDALELGLVDRLGYRDEALAHVLEQWGGPEPLPAESLRFVHRWDSHGTAAQLVRQAREHRAPVVATINLRGAIVTGRGRPQGLGAEAQAGSDVVCEQLRAATRDDRVKAVVLHVDSPGGSANASDQVWRAVHQVRGSGRPVVAQMGAVAASGGYYAAMGADEVVALPATLTGSIGVLAGKLVVRDLLARAGLVHEPVDAGANAGMLAADQPFTEEQWHRLDAWLDRIYADFTQKAAADRGMDPQELERVARGRVWTGRQALECGLVDHLGGRELAIERACRLAGLERERVQLRALPVLGVLDRLRPAQSTEQPVATRLPEVGAALSGEALLASLARRLGVEMGAGVLSAPRVRLH